MMIDRKLLTTSALDIRISKEAG